MANTITESRDRAYRVAETPGYYAPGTVYQNYVRETVLKSSKTKGQFITVDGNQFRKATDLVKSTFTLLPGSPQYTDFRTLVSGTYRNSYYRTSGGGFRMNLFRESITWYSSSGTAIKCLASEIPHQTTMRNEAVTKALVKIADQKVNLGENLATLGQTLRLIGSPVKNLIEGLHIAYRDRKLVPYAGWGYRRIIRELERNRKFNLPRDAANRYLEYVYGWKPLMEDIFTLVEMAKKNSENPLLLNARGSSTREYYLRPASFWDASGSTDVSLKSGTDLQTTRCSIWAKVLPEHAGLRALNQLGLVNPFSLTWELMPWSFVIDWLLPLGPVFQALTAPAGLQFLDGSLSTRQRVRGQYTMEYKGGSTQSQLIQATPATGAFKKDSYTRNRLTSWPAPGFWVDTDPFRGDRDFKALALAISNLRGLGKF